MSHGCSPFPLACLALALSSQQLGNTPLPLSDLQIQLELSTGERGLSLLGLSTKCPTEQRGQLALPHLCPGHLTLAGAGHLAGQERPVLPQGWVSWGGLQGWAGWGALYLPIPSWRWQAGLPPTVDAEIAPSHGDSVPPPGPTNPTNF